MPSRAMAVGDAGSPVRRETADNDVGVDDRDEGRHARRRAARVSLVARVRAVVSLRPDGCRARATRSAALAMVLIPARSRHSSIMAPMVFPLRAAVSFNAR